MSPKKILQSQITGRHGEVLVEAKLLEMGYIFNSTTSLETGIDGYLEIRDSETGFVTGKQIAVQVKTTYDQKYISETEESFSYSCKKADYEYFNSLNLPIIIVIVRLSDSSMYWKVIKNSNATSNRKLIINKKADCFNTSTKNTLASLVLGSTSGG